MSWLLVFIDNLVAFIVGIVVAIIYIRDPFSEPFILNLEIFGDTSKILFKVKNNTNHSLDTVIRLTPIVHDGKYSTQEYNIVLM